MDHETKVQTWNENYQNTRNDIVEIYHEEIKNLIKKIYPDDFHKIKAIEQQKAVMRRGPYSKIGLYSEGVHQDYCFGPEKYYKNIHAQKSLGAANDWLKKWNDPSIRGMVVLCFWRTINMEGPLRHRPLCLCDPATNSRSDVVDISVSGSRNS